VLEEECLSLPAIEVPVKRMDKILIRAWNMMGKELNLELSVFPVKVYQREIKKHSSEFFSFMSP
jgi:peptide deformylase